MTNSKYQATRPNRRKFVKDLAISATAFTIIPRHVLGGTGFIAPSDKVNIAVVGVGGRGKQNAAELLKLSDVQVTAIADPAEYWDLGRFYYKSLAGKGPTREMIEDHYSASTPNFRVAEYDDFREMLEKEQALDAVLCATPDHNHAYVSLVAMKHDKHVYCEKPLTHNLWEAREVGKVAREKGLATQMGNQLHSSEALRQAVEVLRSGVLGDIKEMHAWVGASRWTDGLEGLPTDTSILPVDFNWDLWLGPRADRDYNEVYAPVTWRDFWDFGCGAMGDFGCHELDIPTWGLDLSAAKTVELFPAGYSDKDIAPHGEIGYFEFDGVNQKTPIKLTWYAGGLRPPHPELMPENLQLPGRGSMYIGEKGVMVYRVRQEPELYPASLNEKFKKHKPTLAPTNGHHRDWVDAIKGGPAASSNFDYAVRLTEITLQGVLSLRLGGQKIYWDAENLKAVGVPEADQFINEPVRNGWEMA
ncbi:MAG: oxidoreductase [Cyclobacteriaceae bacterium]|nr:MAG: oxidoreductase [Cyclobacteriaceae bacterium]